MPKNTSAFNNTIKDFENIRKYIHSIFLNPSRSKSDFEEVFGVKSSSFRDMISRIQNYLDGAHIETHSLPDKKGKDNNQAFHFVGNPYNTPVHYLADIFSNASYTLNEMQFYFAFLMTFAEISNEDSLFKSKHSDEPIIIEINNIISAYNRAAFLFSDNDTYAIQSDENDQIYRLYIDFYSSEKREILDKIKSLGQYATIISCPENDSFS